MDMKAEQARLDLLREKAKIDRDERIEKFLESLGITSYGFIQWIKEKLEEER